MNQILISEIVPASFPQYIIRNARRRASLRVDVAPRGAVVVVVVVVVLSGDAGGKLKSSLSCRRKTTQDREKLRG